MASLWPWIVVAGVGALHGLNPATGWPQAARQGVRGRHALHALRALVPIGLGHLASVALMAGLLAFGLALDPGLLRLAAGVLLASIVGVAILLHVRGCKSGGVSGCKESGCEIRCRRGTLGLVLWSFAMSTLHGAGLMLLPALMSVCMADAPAREITASGSLLLALAALGVHLVAMLAVTGLLAVAACVGWDAATAWLRCRPQALLRVHEERVHISVEVNRTRPRRAS